MPIKLIDLSFLILIFRSYLNYLSYLEEKINIKNKCFDTGNRKMLNTIAKNLNLKIPIVQLNENIGKNCKFYLCYKITCYVIKYFTIDYNLFSYSQ